MTDRFEGDDTDYIQEKTQRVRENADHISESLSDSLEGLKEYAHESGQRLQGLLKNLSNQANNGVETVENKIKSRPLLAATAAFAVGMIASKLIAARKT